jgi:uncharacterized membrane protein YbhN (UPF0104 family)
LDKARLFSLIKIAWLVAVVAGGVYYFARNYALATQYIQSISVPRLVLSFFLIILMRILHPHLVQRSLALVDSDLEFRQVFAIVSISQLGKYIPGGIWQFVARFAAYRENQLSYKDMGKSFIIENVWLVLGSLFVGVYFIALGQPAFLLAGSGAASLARFFPILAALSISLWVLTVFATEYGVRSPRRKPSWIAALKQVISQTSMWLFFGVSFACLFQDIGSLDDFWFISGVFILSFLAGYLAIFAPGGIGVREYVAVLLLSVLFSSSEIGIAAILHRLLYTLAEFLLAGIALLLNRKNKLPAEELNWERT